jgi:polyisoprenoid-binding protein YceI
MKLLLFFLLSYFSSTENSLDKSSRCTADFKGEVKFSIRNAGLQVEGTMGVHSLDIKFNPENLTQSVIHAKANPSTIQTGINIRDKHLKRSDYFNVDQYPEIVLRSQSISRTSKNKFTGQFELTIKGITKTITIPFVRTQERNAVRYQSNFQINRLDFNLGEPSAILDKEVTIGVDIYVHATIHD